MSYFVFLKCHLKELLALLVSVDGQRANQPSRLVLFNRKVATTADSMAQCVPVAVFKVSACSLR